jgi:CRP-like cAMP-binding protein
MPPQRPFSNQLIDQLPAAERSRLLAHAERVPLDLMDELGRAGQLAPFAYFPIDCFFSLIHRLDALTVTEVALIGSEGMLGCELTVATGVQPFQVIVQGSGSAWRVERAVLLRELANSGRLHQQLDRYMSVILRQVANSAACNLHHATSARLARWLLMSDDRAGRDELQMTQAFLGSMLGVRRVSITEAARLMQDTGLISYRRGTVRILSRAGLKAAACACYLADRKAYRDLMQ